MADSKSYIPEDTLVHTLLRLPVKSLMRFRCVCKLWYQIITSAFFIDAQRKITKDKYLLCRHSDFCALISKEEFTNHRTYYFKPGVFAYPQELINYKFYYYPSPELYGTGRNWYRGFEVCGICNGLLCMVDDFRSYSNIHLLNPVIRKVKTIPKITFELCPDDRFAALCFTYFDDDYKLIRISTPSCWSFYRVGVYSLRTNCWKFTTFGSKYNTFHLSNRVMSICVGGVAYFPHDKGRIVCFNLHDERLSEVQLPAETLSWYFSWDDCRDISMQPCGESIALMRIKDRYLEKWVLKNRDATDDNTWETKTVTNLRTEAPDYSMESSDVGAYMLCDITGGIDNLYLCGNPEITSQVDGIDNYNLAQDLKAIDCHTANLLLLNEETLGPLFKEEETETELSNVLYRNVRTEYCRKK